MLNMSSNDANGGSGLEICGDASVVSTNNVNVATSLTGAKITQIKTSVNDGTGTSIGCTGSLTVPSVSNGSTTILTSSGVTTGPVKLACGNIMTTSIGTPISLSTTQTPTATAIRAINTGGQSTQVRVVMPASIMSSSMIKQLENNTSGRTQISAVPTQNSRTVSSTSITVSRTAGQAYLPRTGVAPSQMNSMGVTTGQRLVTPVRTAATLGVTGGSVASLSAASNLVRGTPLNRNSPSPATTVISAATSTTWMATNSTGQVQLIRAIPHQPRQRIVTTPGLSSAVGVTSVVGSGTNTVTSTCSLPTGTAHTQIHHAQTNITALTSQAAPNTQPFAASILPPRPHQATLVYSSNMSSPSQPGQQILSSVSASQRFAVATSLAGTASATAPQRQIRPISLGKPFSTAKLNATSISIRTPNLPQLTPTAATNVSGSSVSCSNVTSTRNASICTTTGGILPTTNLSTARIIQLQQQQSGATQQIIGSTTRLPGNVMLQPIIVNTSAAGKISFRPPGTIANKGQPSLTITQLGIGKVPTTVCTSTGQQIAGASLQNITDSENVSSMIVHSSNNTSINSASASAMQIGNVSQSMPTAQILTTQNITGSVGSSTVLPLAINTKGSTSNNVHTGTVTPIKNSNCVAVGKIITQAHTTSAMGENVTTGSGTSGSISPNVYLNQRHSSAATVALVSSNTSAASNASANNVLTLSGVSSSGPFLPPGSTIYYESIPASSTQLSTGGFSFTTTTVTNTTQNHVVNSISNLGIPSLPFTSYTSNSSSTYTPVSTGGPRNIGQLQIPVSNASSQIQAIPVRFNSQPTCSSVGSDTDAIAVSQSTSHLAQDAVASSSQQILLPTLTHSSVTNAFGGQQNQSMLIPLQTSIKINSSTSSSVANVSSTIRKRESNGSPVRCAKNLGPTLLSMGSNTSASTAVSTFNVLSISAPINAGFNADKIRTTQLPSNCSSRPGSPYLSEGSTTVSANSSPGVEQQLQDNLVLGCIENNNGAVHFNPINEMYLNHSVNSQTSYGVPSVTRTHTIENQLHASSIATHLNDAVTEGLPQKKLRRSTNDSQLSTQSLTSYVLPPPGTHSSCNPTLVYSASIIPCEKIPFTVEESSNNKTKLGNVLQATNNKENAKPVEYRLRRRRNCTLLNTYKQTWKSAHNHFLRYTDVKPREDRRPTVIDLVNQSNVLSKINGWKLYHLRSQMEDLCEHESSGYEHLCKILEQMEMCNKSPDIERINDLLKGNIQRSKIIADGVSDAQNQMMKIFEHKAHVCDIINRCASKRNFKKREKTN